MTQPRRASTKSTVKQIPSEVSQSLKDFSQQNYEAIIATTVAVPVNPRRPPLHRANEMVTRNHKLHFTKPEPQYRPSEDNDPEEAAFVPSTMTFLSKAMEESVRYVVSKTLRPGSCIAIIISLPTDVARMSGIDLMNTFSSDSSDGLEPMSKNDIQFHDESEAVGSGITFPTFTGDYTSKQDEVVLEVRSNKSETNDQSDYHDIKESPVDNPEPDHSSDSLQDLANNEQPTFPVEEHAASVPLCDGSPAPSIASPKPVPFIPLTSKREIKLVTAGSSAADWFTHGVCHIISKEENKEIQFVPVTYQQNGQEKIESAQTNLFGLAEPDTKEQGNDFAEPDESVSKMTVVDIPIPQATSAVMVVDTSLIPSFNICRPYFCRPADSQSSLTSASSSPEKPPISDTRGEPVPALLSERVQSSITLVDDTVASGKFDDIATAQAASSICEMEDAKKKWLREEEHDSLQAVEKEGDGVESPSVTVAAPLERSESSVSTDYVLVEPANIQSSVVVPESPVDQNATASPVILSMDANDDFVVEPVTSSNQSKCIPHVISGTLPSTTTAELHVNSSTIIHTVKAVKEKFVIVGGVVQRTPKTPKPEKTSEQLVNAADSRSPESLQDLISSPAGEGARCLQGKVRPQEHDIHPERSSVLSASDGWSTDGEVEGSSAHSVIDLYRSDIYEMSIKASPPETVQRDYIACSGVGQLDSTITQEDINHAFRDASVSNLEIADPTATVQKFHHSCDTNTDQHQSTPDADTGSDVKNPGPDVENSEDGEKASGQIFAKGQQYEIIAGHVYRKTASEKSRPPTPSKVCADNVKASNTPTPDRTRSTASNHSPKQPVRYYWRAGRGESFHSILGRVRATISPRSGRQFEVPEAARKFIECGDMADKRTLGSLMSEQASCSGASHLQHAVEVPELMFSPKEDEVKDEPMPDSSQFGYGKTRGINQPSVREEIFDPFDKDSAKNLKNLKEKNLPLLDSLDDRHLKGLFEKAPNCFCGKMCTRFDGIVPVYVCGTFRRFSAMSPETRGCAFHMHVLFWESLRDTFVLENGDRKKTFSSGALTSHLTACPYLNLTFCVKFSQRNNFNMYLPAEIRATNTCACDLDMRLDFSEILQQWTFCCPHYHQQGVSKKCVRRVFAKDSRYILMDSSPNLHGGSPAPINGQTVADGDEKLSRKKHLPPVVRLAQVSKSPVVENTTDDEDVDTFKGLLRAVSLNSAGTKDWLGDNPADEDVVSWEHHTLESKRKTMMFFDKVMKSYLLLEKQLDVALCENIKSEEKQRREEAKLRLTANVVPCVACTETAAMCVFIPCFHMVMCEKCSDKVKYCPSCRKEVEDRQRVYTA